MLFELHLWPLLREHLVSVQMQLMFCHQELLHTPLLRSVQRTLIARVQPDTRYLRKIRGSGTGAEWSNYMPNSSPRPGTRTFL